MTRDRTGGIQVIGRAAAILRLLAEQPAGLSLAAIAGRVGLARSTVQRIVQALEAEGFAELSGPGGGFQLGPSLSELVYRRQIDIVTEVRPEIEALCSDLQETVALCTMTGGRITTLDRCIAEQPLRVVFPLGTIPCQAHVLAPGRAMLAELPRDRALQFLMESLSETEAATEWDRLVRHRDAAHDTEPFIDGLSGFAVPLRTHLGLYAIAVILPTSRAENRGDAIFTALRSQRQKVEAKIGIRSEGL